MPLVRAGQALPQDLIQRLAARGATIDPALDLGGPETPEQAAERRRQQAANRAARWRARRPVIYSKASLGDLLNDPHQRQAAETARDWWRSETALTLICAGPVGTGKTHLAYSMGNHAVEQGKWVEVWTMPDLLRDLRPDGDEYADDRARACDVLILDDMNALKVSEWAAETLTSIVDARVSAGKRQIVTTNAPADVLTDAWGTRLMDRLLWEKAVAEMKGESRRKAAW